MKRSPELTPLSHDHHQALFVAIELKRGEDPAAAAEAFLEFWRSHGREHFRIEEELLLPAWLEGDGTADRALASRVLDEHLRIRCLARRLERETLSVAELRELGATLERHVRFEERELFPLIEAGLDAEAIARLGAEIARLEPRHD